MGQHSVFLISLLQLTLRRVEMINTVQCYLNLTLSYIINGSRNSGLSERVLPFILSFLRSNEDPNTAEVLFIDYPNLLANF